MLGKEREGEREEEGERGEREVERGEEKAEKLRPFPQQKDPKEYFEPLAYGLERERAGEREGDDVKERGGGREREREREERRGLALEREREREWENIPSERPHKTEKQGHGATFEF